MSSEVEDAKRITLFSTKSSTSEGPRVPASCVLGVVVDKLRAGVELEGGPVEGLFEDGVRISGMEEPKLGVAQGGGRVFALAQSSIKRIHQLRRGGVADFPEGADDIVRARTQKGPGEADQAFAGIRAGAGAVASGDSHKLGVQAMLDDIAGVKFKGVAFLAEDHPGFQRPRAAGAPLPYATDIGQLLGVAGEVGRWRGLLPFQPLAIRVRKVALDFVHFRG